MGEYVVSQVVKLMIKKNIKIKNSKVLILGIAFKENCNDIRNSKVFDIIKNFEEYDIKTTIFDPLVLPILVKKNQIKNFNNTYKKNKYDAIVLAVNHKEFKTFKYKENLKKNSVLYDVKRVLKNKNIDGGL
jgi:UDP-N-acetyl-D-galactosamine dehydrogenase